MNRPFDKPTTSLQSVPHRRLKPLQTNQIPPLPLNRRQPLPPVGFSTDLDKFNNKWECCITFSLCISPVKVLTKDNGNEYEHIFEKSDLEKWKSACKNHINDYGTNVPKPFTNPLNNLSIESTESVMDDMTHAFKDLLIRYPEHHQEFFANKAFHPLFERYDTQNKDGTAPRDYFMTMVRYRPRT